MNFDEWWNEDYDDKDNPFEKDSFGYWAYAGWCAALAEPEQEPVDLLKQSEREGWRYANECELEIKRLRAEKREWIGLTDEEIINWWESENGLEGCDMSKLFDFSMVVRIVQAKLKEKNSF